MTTILKQAKRASQASKRWSALRARLRVALSMETEALPGHEALAAFAANARRYLPPVVFVAQDLNVLQEDERARDDAERRDAA
ncbi:hypothetical protein [Burkholderia ubonensis]|uniref:hypothetical protein n=1 Tax=Burkholderia ubonensis TaxID=101571 RepID=UPI002AB22EE7|nr:hypothetical protein [Burkholderia ubonensis]